MSLLSQLKKIVMLGRQAGYFLIVACQRPDAKYFGDGIRDNFNFRVGLGRISELGYGMLFGSDVKKQFFQKRIKGRGYADVGTSVISEFYTPLVPKGHDFLQSIGELQKKERPVRNTNRPYFSFKISFGVQSRNSQSLAKMARSILETLFLQ